MTNNNSYGGGQNTRKINPLFKDVKEYNKYLLSLIGIFVLLLSGIISYNYTNTSYAKWSSSVESKNVLKLSVKNGQSALKFAKVNVGTGGLEEVTHEIDNTLQVDSRFKTEYRYRGGESVVNNYVTFNDEVWRIIGIIPTEDTNGNVENRFKMIKSRIAVTQVWSTTSNNWTIATLNTYFNGDYYNTLTSNAKSMIGTTKYYLGGYLDSRIVVEDMWQYERKNEANRTGYFVDSNPIMQNDADKKIALMYASDYGYAASKECTNTLIAYRQSSYCISSNNWLDTVSLEWYLAQNSQRGYVFRADMYGGVSYDAIPNSSDVSARPVLTLSSNVKISGGSGTSSDPYQLSL